MAVEARDFFVGQEVWVYDCPVVRRGRVTETLDHFVRVQCMIGSNARNALEGANFLYPYPHAAEQLACQMRDDADYLTRAADELERDFAPKASVPQ